MSNPLISRKEQFDLMNVCFAADKSLKKKTSNIKYLMKIEFSKKK